MKKFTSILATALIAASLFLSSPFPASGDNSLTKIIHFQKTDPSTRSISDADLPEASIRNDELSVSFDDSGMYSLYIEDNFGVTVYSSAMPANGMIVSAVSSVITAIIAYDDIDAAEKAYNDCMEKVNEGN